MEMFGHIGFFFHSVNYRKKQNSNIKLKQKLTILINFIYDYLATFLANELRIYINGTPHRTKTLCRQKLWTDP